MQGWSYNCAMAVGRNIDDAEVSKFEGLARSWWDPQGKFKPLHDINPLRLGYIAGRAELAGKQALDVGCGGGILAESLAAAGAEVTGIDVAEGPLEVARLHLHESGLQVDYRQTTVEALAAEGGARYDLITCLEMLEHVPDPGSALAACAQLLKPDGQLFLSTINRNPKSYLFAIIGAEYVLGLLPKGTHDYGKLIRPSELAAWCRAAGLGVDDLTGMIYNPLTRAYRLSPDVSVNYLAHARAAA